MSVESFERAWLFAMAFSLALVILGWRGRRTHDRPTCRKCRFDLTGLHAADAPSRAKRCPECGSVLARRRAVRLGDHRKRWALIVAGPSVAIVSSIVVWLVIVGWKQGHNWVAHKPTSLLTLEARYGSEFWSMRAIEELRVRLDANMLSPAQIRAANRAALATQTDVSTDDPWRWSDWVTRSNDLGLLSAAEVVRVNNHAWSPQLTLPSRAVCGATIDVQAVAYERGYMSLHANLRDVRIRTEGPGGAAEHSRICEPRPVCGRVVVWTAIQAPSTPGLHTVTVAFAIDCFDRKNPGVILGRRDWSVSSALEVVARSEDPVAFMEGDCPKALVRPFIGYVTASAREESGVPVLTVRNDFYCTLPVNVAFEVTARQNGRRWKVGYVSSPARPRRYVVTERRIVAEGLEPGDIDLTFAATEEAVRQAADLNGKPWRGELVHKGLPVEWLPPAP